MPLISVIVPIYNAATCLESALNSLLQQHLKDWEAWLINDGSSDYSLAIIERYAKKDQRFKILTRNNCGYGASVNVGIDKAEGEYIAIFEPDDLLDPEIYQQLYYLAKKTGCFVVKCNYFEMWGNKDILLANGQFSRYAKQTILDLKEHPEFLAVHASIWAGIYQRSFIRSSCLRLLETPGAAFQDISFTFKTLIMAGKIALLDIPLVYYRQDNASSSINNAQKVYSIKEEFEEIDRFLSNYPDRKIYNTQRLINQYRGYLWNLSRIEKKWIAEFIQYFAKTFSLFWQHGELTKGFFKKINRYSFFCLVKWPQFYTYYYLTLRFFKGLVDYRKKLIRIHKVKQGWEIVFCGEQLGKRGKN